jgi:hypothetical protein
MKPILLVTMILSVSLLAGSPQNIFNVEAKEPKSKRWVLVAPKNEEFSVEMPEEAEMVVKTDESRRAYQCQTKAGIYKVVVEKLGKRNNGQPNEKEVFNLLEKEVISFFKPLKVEKVDILERNNPGRELRFSKPPLSIRVQFWIRSNNTYTTSWIGLPSEEPEKFFASFKFSGQNKEALGVKKDVRKDIKGTIAPDPMLFPKNK